MQNNQNAPYIVFKSCNRLNTQTGRKHIKNQTSEVDQPLECWQTPSDRKNSKKKLTMKRSSVNNYHFARKPTWMEMSPNEATSDNANEDESDSEFQRTRPTTAHQQPHKVIMRPSEPLRLKKNID